MTINSDSTYKQVHKQMHAETNERVDLDVALLGEEGTHIVQAMRTHHIKGVEQGADLLICPCRDRKGHRVIYRATLDRDMGAE